MPPVQADQLSLERDIAHDGLFGLLEATIGSETGGVGGAMTGSEIGVGDAIPERVGR